MSAVWIVVRTGQGKPGNWFACNDLDLHCPSETAEDALAAYATRWPSADMNDRIAVRAQPTDLPDWAAFQAGHCFRVLPRETGQ